MLPAGYEALLEKYGPDILLSGQALLTSRRASAGIVSPASVPPVPIPPVPNQAKIDYLEDCRLAVESRRREIRVTDDYKRFKSPVDRPRAVTDQVPEPPPTAAPKPVEDDYQVNIIPLIGIRAGEINAGGAWRVWQLGKVIDKSGSGVVYQNDLYQAAHKLGVHPRSLARWVSDGLRRKWITKITRRDGRTAYQLLGAARIAESLGIDRVTSRAVIDLRRLYQDGWKAYVWAAFLTCFDGPVSRETLLELTGVPVRTQSSYESQLGIQHTHNLAVSTRPGDHAEGLQEAHESAFQFVDYKRGRKTFAAWRLPDTRHVPIFVSSHASSRGRVRKINHYLSGTSLSSMRRASGEDVVRLFYDDYKKAEQTTRKLTRQGDSRRVNEVYTHRVWGKYNHSRIFDVLPA